MAAVPAPAIGETVALAAEEARVESVEAAAEEPEEAEAPPTIPPPAPPETEEPLPAAALLRYRLVSVGPDLGDRFLDQPLTIVKPEGGFAGVKAGYLNVVGSEKSGFLYTSNAFAGEGSGQSGGMYVVLGDINYLHDPADGLRLEGELRGSERGLAGAALVYGPARGRSGSISRLCLRSRCPSRDPSSRLGFLVAAQRCVCTRRYLHLAPYGSGRGVERSPRRDARTERNPPRLTSCRTGDRACGTAMPPG